MLLLESSALPQDQTSLFKKVNASKLALLSQVFVYNTPAIRILSG